MQYPKISVITPSFNQGQFLEGTIQSVLNQNYPNLEYIIMDGGSTDKSVEIIKKYEKFLKYWQSKPDGGQSAAINEGFRHATGEIFAWLNSDDRYTEGALKTVAEYFVIHPDCQWLTGIGKTVNLKNKIIKINIPKKIDYVSLTDWYSNIIYQPSTFWRKSLWDKVAGLNENLQFSMDFDLWLKFAKVTGGHSLNHLLSIALQHEQAKTKKQISESFVETGLVLCLNGEFEKAKKLLSRPVKRAFELDTAFRFVTNNPLYRKWRESRERV